MEFKEFKKIFQENFAKIVKDETHLYEVNVDKDEMWDIYLDSFPEGSNEIYKEKREYDCSCCRSFIREMGNVVVIKDDKFETIWNFKVDDVNFQAVIDTMHSYIKTKKISDFYVGEFQKVGTDKNLERFEDGTIIEWHHFHLKLPKKFINASNKSIDDVKGRLREPKNVFRRSLEELTENSVLVILELIASNNLEKGIEYKAMLEIFLRHKVKYAELDNDLSKELYAWKQSPKVGDSIAKIRNTVIGTLLIDISENIALDIAVNKYERKVMGENFKRPKPIYSPRMLKEAEKKFEELGYMDSLARRHARLDDITVNDTMFCNRDSAKDIMGGSIFTEMSKAMPLDIKKFSRVKTISIADFVKDVLPNATEIEAFLENRHSTNMVSLVAPINVDSKSMFKWKNGFGYAYTGNIADSSMKQRVEKAGGKVDGILRFSIQWNDLKEHNRDDLDGHTIEPSGNRIYFSSDYNPRTTGKLDIDIQRPSKGQPAVENITWSNRSKMEKGTYKFMVHQYANRGGTDGFCAEIEFDGELYSFEYRKPILTGDFIDVAEVHFDGEKFTIKELLPSTTSSRDLWNLKTNQFVPISIAMLSPNYWDGEDSIGNKHYFFMLKDCINPEQPNGFYNEFLNQELNEYRKVTEALGSKMSVEHTTDQLSGLGFPSTKSNEMIVKVIGKTESVMKIQF